MEILSKKMFIAPNGQEYALYTKNRDFNESDFEITATKSVYIDYNGKPKRIENVYQLKPSQEATDAYLVMTTIKGQRYRLDDRILRQDTLREVIPSDGIFTFGTEMRGVRNQVEKANQIMQNPEVDDLSSQKTKKRIEDNLHAANVDLETFLDEQNKKIELYLELQSEVILREDDDLEAYREKIRKAMAEVKLMRKILKTMYNQKLAKHPLITANDEFTQEFMKKGFIGHSDSVFGSGDVENYINRNQSEE